MSEHLPMTLADLQVAIEEGKTADIRAFYQACEVESGNDRLLEYGKEYGFQTTVVEKEPVNGRRLMLSRDLSRVLYNSTRTDGPKQILSRQGVEFISIGRLQRDVVCHLRTFFQLEEFDNRTTFATYADFLLVAMHGQTEVAKKVKARIMQAEARERTREKVRESTGLHPEDLEAGLHSTQQDPILAQLTYLIRQHQHKQDQEIRQLQESDADTKQRQDATEKTVEEMRSYSRMTLPDYAALHEYDKRWGKKWYKECGIELVNVHRINGKDVLREGIASEVYHHLNRYLVYIMDTFVPRWLMQLYGRGGL